MANLTFKDLELGLLHAFTGGVGLCLVYMAFLIYLNGYIHIATQNKVLTIFEFGLIGILGLVLAWRQRK